MSYPLKTRTIYLDHAATTPLDSEVYEVMIPYFRDTYGNPSSIHHVGRAAFDTLTQARCSLADSLAVKPEEIIITSSGTESDNLALLGLARAHRGFGNHIIVSAIEHKAILGAAGQLEEEGFTVTYLPVDEYGLISLDELKNVLLEETILVSVMYANNEIGTIQPIAEIADLLTKHYLGKRRPVFHTDACQAVGMLPIGPSKLGVDAMTINSSKIYGPKGIGLLYLKAGIPITPILVGGGQEKGRRAGTENVALSIGFAKALEIAVRDTDIHTNQLTALQTHFLSALQINVPTHILNGHPNRRLPNNVHLCIPDIEGEAMLLLLDSAGICAATGSACNAADLEPSHVLRAIGRSDDIIHGSLRFTFGRETSEEDLIYTAKTLGEVVSRLLSMTASSLSITKNYAKHT